MHSLTEHVYLKMLIGCIVLIVLVLLAGCSSSSPISPTLTQIHTSTPTKAPSPSSMPKDTPTPTATSTNPPTQTPSPTRDPNFIPRFVNTNYIELEKIWMISLFRSGEGHDFSDSHESCRSMKHYFKPYEHVDWSKVRIFSPVTGTVIITHEEWAGTQIHIRPQQQPSFTFVIFHVNLVAKIVVGSQTTEGMELGTHVGKVTHSDIAVFDNSSADFRLVSYFDVMTDDLFEQYQIRGAQSRTDLVISRTQRDEALLVCDGEIFTYQGNRQNWFVLK